MCVWGGGRGGNGVHIGFACASISHFLMCVATGCIDVSEESAQVHGCSQARRSFKGKNDCQGEHDFHPSAAVVCASARTPCRKL